MKKSFKKNKFLLEFILITIWIVITLTAVSFHEPWGDELQDWLLAKNLSYPELLNQMRYEGHFLLWFIPLKVLTCLHLPLFSKFLLAWGFVLWGVILVLFYSPFERWLKAVIVFSAPFLYWYPVLSRCYCLIPVVLFSIAIIYPNRLRHPWIYGILVALLAHIHIYMEGIVFVLFLLMCYDFWMAKDQKDRMASFISIGWACASELVVLIMSLRVLSAPNTLYFRPPVSLAKVAEAFSRFARDNMVTQLYEMIYLNKFVLIILTVFMILFISMLFRKSQFLWPYIILCALAIIGTWDSKWTIRIVFLLSAIFILEVKNRKAVFALGIVMLYEILLAIFIYTFLPQRAQSMLIMLIFFAWISYTSKDSFVSFNTPISFPFRIPFFNGKNLADQYSLQNRKKSLRLFEKCILVYAVFCFLGTAVVMYRDFRYPFSQTEACAKFLQKNFAPETTFAKDFGEEMSFASLCAYLNKPVYNVIDGVSVFFNTYQSYDSITNEKKKVQQDVFIDGVHKKNYPDSLLIDGKKFVKIKEYLFSENCVINDTIQAIYVDADKMNLYLPSRKNGHIAP